MSLALSRSCWSLYRAPHSTRLLLSQCINCDRHINPEEHPGYRRSSSNTGPLGSNSASEVPSSTTPSATIPKDSTPPHSNTSKNAPTPFPGFYALPDPVYDNTYEDYFEPTRRAPVRPDSHVLNSNWEPMFFGLDGLSHPPQPSDLDFDIDRETRGAGVAGTGEEAMSPLHHLPIPFNRLSSLMRFPLLTRRVVQQSGKGKIYSQYAMIIVGNGRGLVGLGEGKGSSQPRASERAFAQAVRNLDWVERFEERTLWSEVSTKLGAVKVVMRPRPVGFGLMCAPGVHQVMKAAGVRDVSVKVWGSRNKIGVVKAVVRALQAGSAMVGMGNGVGGEGRRMDAGCGVRGKSAVERERGRRILDARTW